MFISDWKNMISKWITKRVGLLSMAQRTGHWPWRVVLRPWNLQNLGPALAWELRLLDFLHFEDFEMEISTLCLSHHRVLAADSLFSRFCRFVDGEEFYHRENYTQSRPYLVRWPDLELFIPIFRWYTDFWLLLDGRILSVLNRCECALSVGWCEFCSDRDRLYWDEQYLSKTDV